MEIFGIILSVPAAFVASLIYSSLLSRIVGPRALWRALFQRASAVILGLLALEVVALLIFGAARCQRTSGGLFYAIHLTLFLLSVPSLAGLLTLRNRSGWLGKTVVIGAICSVFALAVVLLQYGVSDAIFGPE